MLAPIGARRARWVWRLYGFVLAHLALLIVAEGAGREVAAAPPLVLWTGAAGLAVCLAGGRPPLLALAAGSTALLLLRILDGSLPFQLAEEYLPLALLPVAALGLAGWSALRPGASALPAARAAESEVAQLALLRVSVLVMMAWAAFHKLNSDFFDPRVSCATLHSGGLLALLGGGEALAAWVPPLALAAEVGVPLLLWLCPLAGMAFTWGVMTVIGSQGATPFTAMVMVLACAFASPRHAREAARLLGRHRLALTGLALLPLPLLWGLAPEARILARYGPFASLVAGLGGLLLGLLAPRLRRALAEGRPRMPCRASLWPRERGARVLLGVLVLAALANGATPYLGLKLRLSFAMFSNLRADDARWNHLLVPRGVRGAEHDGRLHARSTGAAPPGWRDGVYTAGGLRTQLERLRSTGGALDLEVERAGEVRRHANAPWSEELHLWLSGLPEGRLFHDRLTTGEPQPCLH